MKLSIFKFRYPKIALLILSIIVAYWLFSHPAVAQLVNHLNGWGYLGILIAGILLSFGFTAAFAVGFFIVLNPENLWMAAIIASVGSALGDYVIFKFIKGEFMDEFNRIKHTKLAKEANKLVEKELGHKIKVYLMYIFAEFVILSPLPDEAGVAMLAGLTKINSSFLTISSFILHIIGILIIIKL